MARLQNKVAMVTGAASGIGRATVLRLAADGAAVMVSDVDLAGAERVAKEITSEGGVARSVICDITQEDSIEAAVSNTVEAFGRLDILHNNAAHATVDTLRGDVDILTIPTELWDEVMAGTLRGTMLGCRYGVKAMLATGGGSIINTTSIYGISAFNRQPAYGVSKAGIHMLTEYVATAFGRQNIRCNAVAPSMVRTPLLDKVVPPDMLAFNADATLTPFLGTPEDIANIVAFLASDESRYLTGQVIRADGGTTAHLQTYSDARRYFEQQV